MDKNEKLAENVPILFKKTKDDNVFYGEHDRPFTSELLSSFAHKFAEWDVYKQNVVKVVRQD